MSTAACPGVAPTVLNGQVTTATASNDTFKEFECLSGFYMTGSKTVSCSGAVTAVWTTTPTCSPITDNVEVFPEWWLIAAAVILGLAVLACFLCVLCYYCCGRGNTVVHPYDRYEGNGNGGCCRDGCGCSNGCCRSGCGGACCGTTAGCCLFSSGGGCCPCCRGGGAKKGRGKHVVNGGHDGVYYVSTPPQGHRHTVVTQPKAGKAVGKGGKRKVSKVVQDTPPNKQDEQTAADGGTIGHAHQPHSHAHTVRSHAPAVVHSHAPAVVHSHAPAVVHSHANTVHSHGPAVHSHAPHQVVTADPPCVCCEPSVADQPHPSGGGNWIFVQDSMRAGSFHDTEGHKPSGQQAKDGSRNASVGDATQPCFPGHAPASGPPANNNGGGGTLKKKGAWSEGKPGQATPSGGSCCDQHHAMTSPNSRSSLADVTLDDYDGAFEGASYYVIKSYPESGIKRDQGTSMFRDTGTSTVRETGTIRVASQAGTTSSSKTTTTVTGINFRSADSDDWHDYSNQRKRGADSDVTDASSKQKKAKEVKGWMPHSNPVRTYNTSTK